MNLITQGFGPDQPYDAPDPSGDFNHIPVVKDPPDPSHGGLLKVNGPKDPTEPVDLHLVVVPIVKPKEPVLPDADLKPVDKPKTPVSPSGSYNKAPTTPVHVPVIPSNGHFG